MDLNTQKSEIEFHLKNRDALSALAITGDVDQAIASQDINKAFLAAEIYKILNGFDEASKLYNYCWQLDPSDASIKTKLIESYMKNNVWDKAIDIFLTTGIDEQEFNRQAHFVIASILSSGQLHLFPDVYEAIRNHIANIIKSPALLQLFHLTGNTASIISVLKQIVSKANTSYEIAVLTEILIEHFKSMSGEELLDKLCNLFGEDHANRSWFYYQLLRTRSITDLPSQPEEEPSIPIEQAAFDYLTYPKTSSILHQQTHGFQPIEIEPNVFKEGIVKFQALIQEMLHAGDFKTQVDNIQHYLDEAPEHCQSPIFILSSGRSGTTALHQKLQKLPETFSYHSYQWQMNIIERNHVLYRMLTNSFGDDFNLEPFKETIKIFVRNRCSELIYAIRKGKAAVFTGHWDTIFTPIWATIFPKSKFIHLHRDHKSVFKSIYIKNQWFNNNFQPYLYDSNFSNGMFHAGHIHEYGLTERASWFLYTTECFAHLFFDTLPPHQSMHVKSEDLFNADENTYRDLIDFLAIPSLDMEGLIAHYKNPINSKDEKPVFRTNLKAETEKMILYLQQLEETGKLTVL